MGWGVGLLVREIRLVMAVAVESSITLNLAVDLMALTSNFYCLG